MQQIKGPVLMSRLGFVEQLAGKDGVERVLATLGGHGRAQFFERLGAASAETNLATVHRAFRGGTVCRYRISWA